MIVGPLSDAVTEKLLSDSGQTFARCETEYMNCSQEALEKGMSDNVLIDFRRRGSHFECTTVAAIRDVIDRVSELATFFASAIQVQATTVIVESTVLVEQTPLTTQFHLLIVESPL